MKDRDKLLVTRDVIEELERIYPDESPSESDILGPPSALAFKAGQVDVVRKLRRIYDASLKSKGAT